ncbi:helix-turn-helix domain-containing protein [Lentzea pudingi]|uniref:helix-turn-helix domain-containing protein n=1 Tax=Lentzea pudingi TaxID=1789439 RepID=UPI0035712B73
MYDSGKHTVEKIAETFNVGRTALYRQLHAYGDDGACVLVVYRNTRARKVARTPIAATAKPAPARRSSSTPTASGSPSPRPAGGDSRQSSTSSTESSPASAPSKRIYPNGAPRTAATPTSQSLNR